MTLLSNAGIAQLVERNLAKVEVESSRLFSRSRFKKRKPERLPFLFPVSFFCFIPPLRSCSFSFMCGVMRVGRWNGRGDQGMQHAGWLGATSLNADMREGARRRKRGFRLAGLFQVA